MNRFLYYLIPLIFIGTAFSKSQDPKETSVDPIHSGNISTDSITTLSQNGQEGSSKSSIYLQFSTSGLYSWLKDWRTQNLQLDGTSPSTLSMIFGAECGYVINKYFQIGLGYEFFFTTKIATQQATGDQINSTFFYGSIRAEMPLESVPDLSLFANLDIGSIAATEALEDYSSYVNLSRAGSTMGYRIMLGAQYFLVDNWSIMAGGGYLFGKINKVTVNGQTWPNYSLDLSGFTLRFAVNYHIPL
jgi:opacity protein-like surface antigen